jgi:hypothetical protein
MSKQQTAVEWLYNNLKSHFEHDGDLLEVVHFSFDQAKAMEKEQIGYSEEEVLEIIRQYALEEHLITSSKPDIWFEQFKKK